MDEGESLVVQDSSSSAESSESDPQPVQTETVVYTDQLNQVIETQQLQLAVSLVFIGIFIVSLIVSVFNRFL